MNRAIYFNYIEGKLSSLTASISNRGSLNLLDSNIYSEVFFASFLNSLFGWNLKNLNALKRNHEAVDLFDKNENLYVQVSSTSSKRKIETSLNSDFFLDKPGCRFVFLCITADARNLTNLIYSNPYSVLFDPLNDILDIKSILNSIKEIDIVRLKELYDLTRKELGDDLDISKCSSNLSTIVDILSKVPFSDNNSVTKENVFEIEKKIIHNGLGCARRIIDDNSMYCTYLDKTYKEFDKLGLNKSLAVLNSINKHYTRAISTHKYGNPDQLFLGIIDELIDDVRKSANCPDLTVDELELCICIVTVDAFLRCKIFKNPNGANYAVA